MVQNCVCIFMQPQMFLLPDFLNVFSRCNFSRENSLNFRLHWLQDTQILSSVQLSVQKTNVIFGPFRYVLATYLFLFKIFYCISKGMNASKSLDSLVWRWPTYLRFWRLQHPDRKSMSHSQ